MQRKFKMSLGSQSFSATSSILRDRVNRALSIDTESPSTLMALDNIASLIETKPNTTNREEDKDPRSLRESIERDALENVTYFESQLFDLVNHVGEMRQEIETMKSSAKEVERSIFADLPIDDDEFMIEEQKCGADRENHLAKRISQAFRECDDARIHHEEVIKFVDTFEVSRNDGFLLDRYDFSDLLMEDSRFSTCCSIDDTNNPSPHDIHMDGMKFLDILERIRKIRNKFINSLEGSLFSSTKVGNSSSLRLLESLADRSSRAHERLYNFLLVHLNLLESERHSVNTVKETYLLDNYKLDVANNPEERMDGTLSHPFVIKSLTVLRKSAPTMHAHVIERIAFKRRSVVTKRFLLALTYGYENAPAIEVKGHDSLGYVGDMLAFVHRSMECECDLVASYNCFSYGNGGNNDEHSYKDYDGKYVMVLSPREALREIVGGLSRPLSNRIRYVADSLKYHTQLCDPSYGDPQKLSSSLEDSCYTLSDQLLEGIQLHNEDESLSVIQQRIVTLHLLCGILSFYSSVMNRTVEKLIGIGDNDTETGNINPVTACIQKLFLYVASVYDSSLHILAGTLKDLTLSFDISMACIIKQTITEVLRMRKESPGFDDDFSHKKKIRDRHMIIITNNCKQDDMAKVFDDVLSIDHLCHILFGAIFNQYNQNQVNPGNTTIHTYSTSLSSSPQHNLSLDDVKHLRSAVSDVKRGGLKDDLLHRWDNTFREWEQIRFDEEVTKYTELALSQYGLKQVWKSLMFVKSEHKNACKDSHINQDKVNKPFYFSEQPGLSEKDIENAVNKFYITLKDFTVIHLENVKDSIIRNCINDKTTRNVINVYNELYTTVTGDMGGYSKDIHLLLRHNTNSIRKLLFIDKL